MDKKKLKSILQQERIREDAYSLEDEFESECYSLRHKPNGIWVVYYSERGLESGKQEFTTESDACQYLLKLLRNDNSAH